MLTPLRLARRFWNLITMRRRDRELNEELRFHVEMETGKHVAHGAGVDEARQRALHDFGGVARFRDETRDTHGVRAVEDLLNDLRIGARGLARRPALAVVAILTLAIGIGGTTAVFGAVYGVLLAPLPYRDQDRVVTLWQTDTRQGTTRGELSVPNFIDWRDRSRSIVHMAAAEPFSLDYLGPDGPEVFRNAVVSEGFFEALGTTPLLGRTFVASEFTPGRNQVVVLSEGLWRTRFGGDSSLVGRTLVLDGAPLTVVGVVPREVDVPWNVVAWTPKIFREDELRSRGSDYYAAVGRLRDGATLKSAQREMTAIASDLARVHPATNATTGVAVVPIAEALLGGSRKGLFILLGAMGFVLLIACVNVASLQLAQAVRRRRELATRATLGAGTWRLARQLMAEGLLLAVIGGLLGVVFARWGLVAIRALAPADLPRSDLLQLHPAVLLFAVCVTVGTSLVFGLAPVLEARRLQLAESMLSGGRTLASTRARRRTQNALVVAEVALALVLLVGAGLLVRSFRSLITIERGFQPDHVLVTTVQTWSHYRTPRERIDFAREAIARLSALPGVRVAGMTSSLPLSYPIGAEGAGIAIDGHPVPVGGEALSSRIAAVTPGYFDALRIPLRAGRFLSDADRDSTAAVALVNEAFVRRYWPNENPVGKRVTFGFQARPALHEIVGVVADIRHDGLDRDPQPTIFTPHSQAPTGAMHLVVRTDGDPRALERPVRATIAALNASMPVSAVTTLDALFDTSLRDRRFHLALLGAFSLTALFLSAIGIYSVLSQMTGERTQEIGLRVAVGASAHQVLVMVVRQGTTLALCGVAIGMVGAFALTRVLRGMLFQVTPLDPVTYLGSLTVLLLTACVACWLPARRAAAVDPVVALRE